MSAAAGSPSLHVLGLINSIVYGMGVNGVLTADKDNSLFLYNNILKDNGNAGTEYNLNVFSSAAWVISENNVFNISGGVGGGNVNNYSLRSTDLTSDPLFTNAASGDFTLSSSSPAKAAGYPGAILGGSTGYLDIGAVQRQESSSVGGFKAMFMME